MKMQENEIFSLHVKEKVNHILWKLDTQDLHTSMQTKALNKNEFSQIFLSKSTHIYHNLFFPHQIFFTI